MTYSVERHRVYYDDCPCSAGLRSWSNHCSGCAPKHPCPVTRLPWLWQLLPPWRTSHPKRCSHPLRVSLHMSWCSKEFRALHIVGLTHERLHNRLQHEYKPMSI